jgi:hypothetical protein
VTKLAVITRQLPLDEADRLAVSVYEPDLLIVSHWVMDDARAGRAANPDVLIAAKARASTRRVSRRMLSCHPYAYFYEI